MTAPATSASTGHDHVDDAAFMALVHAGRDRDRAALGVLRRFAPALVLIVLAVIVVVIAVPNFIAYGCRARGSEAKGNLRSLLVAERAFHAEHERYSIDPHELAWKPSGVRLRYSYFVRADKEGFEAVAIASEPVLRSGDLWRIGTSGEIEHLIDGCR